MKATVAGTLLTGITLLIMPVLLSAAHAEEVSEGTKIIGTEESPAVLNVVPWQDRELGGNPASGGKPISSVLDDALKPVDRGELRREIDYFNLLQKNQQDSDKNAE